MSHLSNASPVMCSGTEAGSYFRRIDSCITQLKAQGPLGPVTRVKKTKRVSDLKRVFLNLAGTTRSG